MPETEVPSPPHTVEGALAEFKLVKGTAGSLDDKTACGASLLSWVYDGTLTDHPVCSHPNLSHVMRWAFDDDATTSPEQTALVLAGEAGMLDTWWVPGEVVALARANAPKEDTAAAQAIRIFSAVAAWKSAEPKARPDLRSADLHGADLYGVNLRSADLYGADLYGANLGSADLRSANLRSADLGSANLYSADLRRANLYGADLRRANLYGADLYGADLYGVNLRGADLRSANLRRADLRSANLRRADLRSANLYGANLRRARGDLLTKLPAGWVVQEFTGLVMRATEAEVAG